METIKTRTFNVQITVPVNDNGWIGTHQTPTMQVVAHTKAGAISKVNDIVKHMPIGTAVFLIEV
jgi:hypothetical protein